MLQHERQYYSPAKWIKAFVLLTLMVLAPTFPLSAKEPRDPFNLPERQAAVHDYVHAIRQVTIEGILRTADYKVCLARVADSQRLAVLAEGAVISLEHGGRPHRFSVVEIREKSVVFEDEQKKTYEVPIQ